MSDAGNPAGVVGHVHHSCQRVLITVPLGVDLTCKQRVFCFGRYFVEGWIHSAPNVDGIDSYIGFVQAPPDRLLNADRLSGRGKIVYLLDSDAVIINRWWPGRRSCSNWPLRLLSPARRWRLLLRVPAGCCRI